MTTVSSIITDAYRENNIIPSVSSPTAVQTAEALRRLNVILISTVGNEAGDNLTEYNIDGDFDQAGLVNSWVPDNSRLMLNLEGARTFDLDPYPKEGQRVAIVDVAGNLATYNLVLNGNGRRIEDAASVTLSTDDLVRQWLYRSDAGWVRISELTDSDSMPFPIEFDDYFITMLAVRLLPKYGQSLPAETMEALRRSRSQLRSRYRFSREIMSDVNPRGMMSDMGMWDWNNSGEDFGTGSPYPWRG